MITQCIDFIRKLNIKFMVGIFLLAVIAAIVNNLRVEDSKSVDWIGGQKVLETPE